jgi:hypothetical protein
MASRNRHLIKEGIDILQEQLDRRRVAVIRGLIKVSELGFALHVVPCENLSAGTAVSEGGSVFDRKLNAQCSRD